MTDTTREHVKSVALQIANADGIVNLSRRDLCERAGIPAGSFIYVMGCSFTAFLDELRKEVAPNGSALIKKGRINKRDRSAQLLTVGVLCAKEHGLYKITREQIANRAGVSESLIRKYFKTMDALRRAILREAVRNGVIEIVATGLAAGDPTARKAPPELKERAAEFLVSA